MMDVDRQLVATSQLILQLGIVGTSIAKSTKEILLQFVL